MEKMTGVSGAGHWHCRPSAGQRRRDMERTTLIADLRSRLGRQPGLTGEEGA